MTDLPFGATPLDDDEREGLLIRHITTVEELNQWEQKNIVSAYGWLAKSHRKDLISEAFIKDLHEQMFGKVWSWAGKYRKSNKNIGVDWFQIPVHVKLLLDDISYWIEHSTFSKDEIAVRYHHKLVQIHLFPNGNGRHARLMADIFLERHLKEARFTWGSSSINDQNQTRVAYVRALRSADNFDYQPLLRFVRS